MLFICLFLDFKCVLNVFSYVLYILHMCFACGSHVCIICRSFDVSKKGIVCVWCSCVCMCVTCVYVLRMCWHALIMFSVMFKTCMCVYGVDMLLDDVHMFWKMFICVCMLVICLCMCFKCALHILLFVFVPDIHMFVCFQICVNMIVICVWRRVHICLN